MDENPHPSPEPHDQKAFRRVISEMIDQLFQLKSWRIGVMICVLTSALVTPADPYSLLVVAIPLIVLYFVGVGIRAWLHRKLPQN